MEMGTVIRIKSTVGGISLHQDVHQHAVQGRTKEERKLYRSAHAEVKAPHSSPPIHPSSSSLQPA
jgi:hypothetical protein